MQAVNTWSAFIFLSLFISFINSQSEASIASESSLIPFQFTPLSEPMLHVGGMQKQKGMILMSGLQFQPTKNLLIGGVISPYKIETNLAIYYHIVIGYIPQWKFLSIASNMFQIGMHRTRFGADVDARWFSFSIMETTRFGSLNFNLCWNRLFAQNWDRNTALISTDLKLSNSIHLKPGVLAFITPSFDYNPFFFMSIDI